MFLLGAVFLMGQTSPNRTVEASEFILRDSSGKKRASLGMMLAGPGLALHDDGGKVTASLVASPFGGALSLYGGNRNAINLMPLNGGATLGLIDENGFETRVGTTDLVNPGTGETRWTSAASVVLFDKDKKVLWKAP